jgi:hypothetical protein
VAVADLLGPLCVEMLACAQASLTLPVGRAFVAPGSQIAWDDCCDGQLWVRVTQLNTQDVNVRGQKLGSAPCDPCGLEYAVGIEIGVLRCSSTVTDQGTIASPAVMTDEALQVLTDEAQLSEAAQCCIRSLPGVKNLVMVRWDPLGPEGGCVGGVWTIALTLKNGCTYTDGVV